MTDKQPKGPRARIRAGDATKLRLPYLGLRPLEVRWHPVSVNEIHAVVIGAAAGAVGALAWRAGETDLTVLLAVILMGYAILGRPLGGSMGHDDPEYCEGKNNVTIAVKTIRHEPWWFLGAFILVLVLGISNTVAAL